jgi:hypothetical protein
VRLVATIVRCRVEMSCGEAEMVWGENGELTFRLPDNPNDNDRENHCESLPESLKTDSTDTGSQTPSIVVIIYA